MTDICGWRRDEGSVTLFAAVTMVGMLALLGLAVDGGQQIEAARRADALAEGAARAGGQAINLPDAVQGDRPTLDPGAAVAAAQAYLSGVRVTGVVRVTGPTTLTVRVTIHRHTAFLSLLGIDELTATGNATARLARGVAEEDK